MSNDEDTHAGMLPSQWFVRTLSAVVLAMFVVTLLGSLDDLKRYIRIKTM